MFSNEGYNSYFCIKQLSLSSELYYLYCYEKKKNVVIFHIKVKYKFFFFFIISRIIWKDVMTAMT